MQHNGPAEGAEPLRAALIGTVGTILAFKIGARDAETLAPEFSLKPSDFSLLEPHMAYLRSGANTVELKMPAVRAKRFPSARRRIVNRSRNELAQPRDIAESRIAHLVAHTYFNSSAR